MSKAGGQTRTASHQPGHVAQEDAGPGDKRPQAAQWRREFQHLTGIDPSDREAVKAWQASHGVPPTGLVRAKTIAAARVAAKSEQVAGHDGGEEPADIFAEDGDVTEGSIPEERLQNPNAEAKGEAQDQAAQEEPQADFFEGEGVADDGEVLKNPDAKHAPPRAPRQAQPKAPDFFDGEGVAEGREVLKNPSTPAEAAIDGGTTENQEGGAPRGGDDLKQFGKLSTYLNAAGIESEARRLVLLPRLVELATAGKWKEVIDTLSATVSLKDVLKIAQALAEYAGVELGKNFDTLLKMAPGIDLAIKGLRLQYDGFQQIAQAHAAGKQDNRAFKYAEAWANTILFGEGAHVSAELPEQREAIELARRDALDTLAGWGDDQAKQVGESLIKQYGSAGNAKRALIDELCSRAGFSGLKFHEGS